MFYTSDFVPANEPSKKARPATKSDQTESKSSERAAPRSRRERSVAFACTMIAMDLFQIDEIRAGRTRLGALTLQRNSSSTDDMFASR